MNRALWVLFLHIICFSSLAQPKDSLYQIWHNPDLSDSIRANALSRFIESNIFEADSQKSQDLIDSLKRFAENKNLTLSLVAGLRLEGRIYLNKFEFKKAEEKLNQALSISLNHGFKREEAMALRLLGRSYRYQNDQATAMKNFYKSLNIFEDLKDSKNISSVLIETGGIHKIAKEYDMAINDFHRAYDLYCKDNNDRGLATTLASLGSIYRRLGDTERALILNKEALETRQALGLPLSEASSYNNIGNLYEDLKDYRTALDYHLKALELRQNGGSKKALASSYKNIGSNYFELGQLKRGAFFCKKANDLYEEIQLKRRQSAACECLYEAYKRLGDNDVALYYLEKMRSLESEIELEKSITQLQEMAFEKQLLRDSLTQAKQRQLLEFNHQKAILKEQQSRNRVLIILLAVVFLAVMFYFRWKTVNKSRLEVQRERQKAENLLLNILPADVAEELKLKGEATAKEYDKVSIIFTDFKGFTEIAEKLSAQELVEELNFYFKAFDQITSRYKLEKIKTIGDAYMVVGGLGKENIGSVKNTILAALEMCDFVKSNLSSHEKSKYGGFSMRIGIHTGPVVAGIVGVKKFQYDVWGDTVNTASRMESSGDIGTVNISEDTYNLVKNESEFSFESRGSISVKGKGAMKMYFVNRRLS